jgi:hypothetical protein
MRVAGRTDAGVHARGQVATVHTRWAGDMLELARSRDANSGGPEGRPAPLASRFHSIPTRFPLNLHGI